VRDRRTATLEPGGFSPFWRLLPLPGFHAGVTVRNGRTATLEPGGFAPFWRLPPLPGFHVGVTVRDRRTATLESRLVYDGGVRG